MFSDTRKFGNQGEDLACKRLTELGFTIIERNYLRKWGEIDIVARGTDSTLYFIEVKSIRRALTSVETDVSRDTYMPEENVTREKLHKLERTIDTWLLENRYVGEWKLAVVTMEIDVLKRVARFKMLDTL